MVDSPGTGPMRRLLSGHIHPKASAKSGNPDPGRQISAKDTKARGQTGQTETGEPANPLSLMLKGISDRSTRTDRAVIG
jgi:hypothetical protein